jgi:O-antigen ligase
MIAAGSRGPMLAFVFGLGVLVALTAVDPRARRRLALVATVFLLAAIIVPLVVPGSAIGRSLSVIIGSASGLSSNGRSDLWALAITTFSQHLAFGLGTGGFASLLQGLNYPHNILLEVASELGVVGLIALLVFLGSSSVRLTRIWRRAVGEEKLLGALLISLFVTALINACFSGAIQDNRDIWLWGGLAIGMSTRMRLQNAHATPTPSDFSVT